MNILCLNVGSSSLKCSVQHVGEREEAREVLSWDEDHTLEGRARDNGIAEAINAIFERLRDENIEINGIGHRMVFGGNDFIEPIRLTHDALQKIQSFSAIAPLHIPVQVAFAQAILARKPNLAQAAAFDTAFHNSMPALAKQYPFPAHALPAEVRRFGYHGLSYEYLTSTYPEARTGKVIIAHLGSGASLVALRDGKPQETTMGLTPLGGIMMGSRPGDLDPGLLLYLLRTGAYRLEELDALLEHNAGLKGVSERTSDVKELIARRAHDEKAALAIELFLHLLRKQIGALVAVLEGLDTLIFTAGIGTHSAEIRGEAAAAFSYLGLTIDPDANARHANCISTPESYVKVHALKTDENVVIARHASRVLRQRVAHNHFN